MQDRELYAQILGVREPWRVERVELKLDGGEVHVRLGHAEGLKWACPECGEPSPLYDHQPERCWRHLERVASQKAVADQLRLSWDEVHAIQERAVKRGWERRKAEPVARLGVDEKSFTRGHRYFTLVNDLDRGRVLFVEEGRSEQSMDGFWSGLSEEQIRATSQR